MRGEASLRSAPRIEEHLASWTKGCEGLTHSGGMTAFHDIQSGREFAAALFIPDVLGCGLVSAYKVNTKAQVSKNSHILCERQFERFFGHRLRIEHFSLKGKPHKGPENDFSPLMR